MDFLRIGEEVEEVEEEEVEEEEEERSGREDGTMTRPWEAWGESAMHAGQMSTRRQAAQR